MLIGNFITSLFDVAKYGFFSIFLYIDSVVYKLVSMLFSVFYSLAELQLLNNEVYESIANRVYLLVGVVALFTMTISLLKALVDPDSLSKGTITSFKNLIISIVLLILTPTIFKYAFSFQAAIINDGVITNLFNFTITGKENTMVNTCNNPRSVTVNNAEMGTLNSNNVQNNKEIKMTVNECQSNYITMTILEAFFSPSVDSIQNNYNTSWKDARDYIYYSGDFAYIATFAEQVNKGSGDKYISYYILISTLAGLFLGYIVLSFCLDLGIRAFKLAFYQLIAPIPILMKIVPGKEGQFEKWSKQTISTFLEVFTRLIIISFVVFMCGNMFDLLEGLNWSGVGLLGKAILAIGMFAFAKQAPNLLKDALGLDGSGIKLGIKGKLADGGALAAGAALGAGATTFARNTTNALKNGIDNVSGAAPGFKSKGKAFAKSLFGGAGSVAAGTVSGFARGAKAGWSAKNYSDVRNAAGKAASDAVEARDKRAVYKANHGGTIGAIGGHIKEAATGVTSWAGIKNNISALQSKQSKIKEVSDARKTINDRLNKILDNEKNERRLLSGAINVGSVGNFDRLADLQNEMEIMKSTGKTSSGNNVTASMLTDMAIAEEKLKKGLKSDILNGYDKSGVLNISSYDGELKTALTDYRTKSFQNYQTLASEVDSSLGMQLGIMKTQAIDNQKQTLNDFITSGNAEQLFDKANAAIKNASSNINEKVAKEYQKEQKK